MNEKCLALKSQGAGFLAAVSMLISKFQWSLHYVLACVSNFCKCQVKITNIWYVINEWLGHSLTKLEGSFLTELHWLGLSLLILLGLRKLDSIFSTNKHCGLKSGFFH